MLTSSTNLRDKLVELNSDIGRLPGRRVALLGFRDSNATRVADNLCELKGAAGWTVVDLLSTVPESLPQVLAKELAAPKLAVILDTTRPVPTDALLLIRALHDSHDAVRWSDGTTSALPAKRILYVIASGARELQDLPSWLQRIDFMTFVRAPS
jgi:hypothetical protein